MSTINQKEYLKKYLSSGDKGKLKKRRKKSKIIKDRVKIIDDDIDVSNAMNEDEFREFLTAEDAPQVVGIVDERPLAMRVDDYRKSDKWKLIGSDEEEKEKHNEKSPIDNETIKNKLYTKKISLETKELQQTSVDFSRNTFKNSRNRARDSDSDMSPLRTFKKEKDFDSDTSPPRKRKNSDASPMRNRKSSDSDLSPERLRKGSNPSPPRKMQKNGSDSDLSPVRGNRRIASGPGREAPRRPNFYRNFSPPRRREEKPRKPEQQPRKSRWDDVEKPKQDNEKKKRSSSRERKKNEAPKMTKTLDGKAAGLQNADELKRETEAFKKREAELFKKMAAEVSGVDAVPVMRDRKTGRRRDFEKEVEEEMEKQRRVQEQKEKYDRWGKGVKQVDEQKAKIEQDLYEMSKPLARYADDEDLEKYLKEQEREGDPMLQYLRKKKRREAVASGKPITTKPQYEGEFMPNRFGVPPGHRWDGVDRSNGYEKRWFSTQNSKKAVEEEVYKWSTEDM